jgi:hypothetical protein
MFEEVLLEELMLVVITSEMFELVLIEGTFSVLMLRFPVKLIEGEIVGRAVELMSEEMLLELVLFVVELLIFEEITSELFKGVADVMIVEGVVLKSFDEVVVVLASFGITFKLIKSFVELVFSLFKGSVEIVATVGITFTSLEGIKTV